MESKEQEEARLKGLKDEISTLKSRLDKLNEEKESWFRKKGELQKQISEMISSVKQIKSDKDVSNKALFDERETRDKHNREVKNLIAELRKLKKEKDEFLSKFNLKFDPAKLKEKITRLEESIETEAYSFDREKKVMMEIKKLKRMYDETSQLNLIAERINSIQARLGEEKVKADEAHNKFRELSKTNGDGYKGFIEISKSINDLKKEQEAAFKNFLEAKKEFSALNSQLKQKLSEVKSAQSNIFEVNKEKERVRKSREEQLLREKAKSVEEKLKNGKKLTTEDLIVFQGNKDEP